MMALPMLLRERGFRYAILGSLAWHVFWMFAVSVKFGGEGPVRKAEPRIYFLGPVLTDDSFNMLVATKPELSSTYYRAPADLAAEMLEPEFHNLGHQPTGDLVSIPMGQRTWSMLRGVLRPGSAGAAPLFDDKLPVDIIRSPFPLTGPLAGRDLFQVPELPLEGRTAGKAVFDLSVGTDGKVLKAENNLSSGDPEQDLLWQRWLEAWQFMPAGAGDPEVQTGQVHVGGPGEAR